MPVPLQEIVALTLVPVAAAIAGGAIAVWRAPGEQLRSIIQHFAAGVVFAAVAGVKMFAERLEKAGEAEDDRKVGLLVAS